MAEQPTGTVTLLFSDIEGSTRLLERLGPERYGEALDLHLTLLRDAFVRHDGYEVDCEGDAFFVAFATAAGAVEAAAEGQQALENATWPDDGAIRVRMGIHTVELLAVPPKYVGLDVHRAARLMAAAHGGQVLVSQTTRDLVEADLRDLGEHRLKDLSQLQPIFQLLIDGVAAEFPPPRTLGNRPNNLPVVATPFIGRERELSEVVELLGREHVRLLTLTGAGGIGKTRLALQAAADVLDRYPDGVFWVPLAPVRDASLVVPRIAHTLGVREAAGESVAESLTRHIGEKQLLLLLDNLEHVIDAAPEIASLLAGTRRVDVLLTSRTAARLQGEHRYDVPPLQPPDAVELFAARARSVVRTFDLTPANQPAVAEIATRLEGLPLALELAAARMTALSAEALLQRLDRLLRLLTGGSRDSDERQRTLRATIEWSFDLLDRDERTLLARIAEFVGGCRIDAADAVCSVDPSLDLDVFDGLASLVDKSLLRRRDDPDGEPRYWMLESVREFAADADAGAGRDELRAAHAEWLASLATHSATALHTEGEAEVFTLIAADEANFVRAVAWSADHARSDLLIQLSLGLWWFWTKLSRLREVRELVETALAVAGDEPPEVQIELYAARSGATTGSAMLRRRPVPPSSGSSWHGRSVAPRSRQHSIPWRGRCRPPATTTVRSS